MTWPRLLVIITSGVLITGLLSVDCLSPPILQNPQINSHIYHEDINLNYLNQPINQLNVKNPQQVEYILKDRIKQAANYRINPNNRQQMQTKRTLIHQDNSMNRVYPGPIVYSTASNKDMEVNQAMPLEHSGYAHYIPVEKKFWSVDEALPIRNSKQSEIVIEHMLAAASGGTDEGLSISQFSINSGLDKTASAINTRRFNLMNQQQLDSRPNMRRFRKTKSSQMVHNRLGQLAANASFEDTNWRIAANCLRSHFGGQFVQNKDVKCASSQIVLSISRLQRAACKSCESYFHCEGFSNAIKYCKNNYDVQETIQVIKNCKDLFILGDDEEIDQASKNGYIGIDCQNLYLCKKNCMYNPSDNTCPRNNCINDKFGQLPKWQNMRTELRNSSYPDSNYNNQIKEEKGRAYPKDSPIQIKDLAPNQKKLTRQLLGDTRDRLESKAAAKDQD